MSAKHNYTNPAFCQQSEYLPASYGQSRRISPAKVHRSESVRSVQNMRTLHQPQQHTNEQSPQRIVNRQLPPRPGPKPQINLSTRYAPTTQHSSSTTCSPEKRARYDHIPRRDEISVHNSAEGYALVPLADIPCTDKGRYAYIPAREANLIRSTSTRRITKSQDDLDRCYSSLNSSNPTDHNDSSFNSLPPLPSPRLDTVSPSHMKSAFSTDFVANKSLILVDQKSMQRYAIVPTEEDEELVDANHEIIQMHNGRAHRYAVIPTAEEEGQLNDNDDEEEQETCLSSDNDFNSPTNDKYATIKEMPLSLRQKYATSTPQKQMEALQQASDKLTPTRSTVATQKLFEILSTPPRKCTTGPQHHLERRSSTNQSTYSTTSTPNHRYRSQIISSTPKQSDFVPQKLHYEPQQRQQLQQPKPILMMSTADMVAAAAQYEQQRSTAIISPRLAQQYASQQSIEVGMDKSYTPASEHKVSQATATIGAVSLMLILGGVMNSGLCLYMIYVVSLLFRFQLLVYKVPMRH